MNGLIAQIEKGKPSSRKFLETSIFALFVMVLSLVCQLSCFQVSLS